MNGHSVVATPTVANDPVARNRKSRFVTEAPPWPTEAVSELIVMQRVSKRTSGPGIPTTAPDELNGASAFVYPPPLPLATPRWLQRLVVLDFARGFDDNPPGSEIDARRNTFGKRKKQGFPSVGRRDLENVPSAVVHERYNATEPRPLDVDGFQPDQIIVVEFVLVGRWQLVTAGGEIPLLLPPPPPRASQD